MQLETAKLIVISGVSFAAVIWFWCWRLYRGMKKTKGDFSKEIIGKEKNKDQILKTLLKHPLLLYTKIERTEDQIQFQYLLTKITISFSQKGENPAILIKTNIARFILVFQIIMGIFVYALMPLAIIGVPLLLWELVIPTPYPEMRWQVIQIIQVIHVLWPPFLIYYLFRKMGNLVLNLVNNLAALIQIDT